jgi:hypothetical protein
MPNLLYYGDNLDVFRCYVKDETIDCPPLKHTSVTFKKAPRSEGEEGEEPGAGAGGSR